MCIGCLAGRFKGSAGQDEASDCDGLCAAGRFKGTAGQDEASDCDGLCVAGKVRRNGIEANKIPKRCVEVFVLSKAC